MKKHKHERRPLRVRLDVQPSDVAEIVNIFAQREREQAADIANINARAQATSQQKQINALTEAVVDLTKLVGAVADKVVDRATSTKQK